LTDLGKNELVHSSEKKVKLLSRYLTFSSAGLSAKELHSMIFPNLTEESKNTQLAQEVHTLYLYLKSLLPDKCKHFKEKIDYSINTYGSQIIISSNDEDAPSSFDEIKDIRTDD
jgi:hypothetical protein